MTPEMVIDELKARITYLEKQVITLLKMLITKREGDKIAEMLLKELE